MLSSDEEDQLDAELVSSGENWSDEDYSASDELSSSDDDESSSSSADHQEELAGNARSGRRGPGHGRGVPGRGDAAANAAQQQQ